MCKGCGKCEVNKNKKSAEEIVDEIRRRANERINQRNEMDTQGASKFLHSYYDVCGRQSELGDLLKWVEG